MEGGENRGEGIEVEAFRLEKLERMKVVIMVT